MSIVEIERVIVEYVPELNYLNLFLTTQYQSINQSKRLLIF